MHYESKTLVEDEECGGRRAAAGTKKASLFAWTTLQSIPEETIISPHILEFLEQTLEPIPTQTKSSPFTSPGEFSENACFAFLKPSISKILSAKDFCQAWILACF